jgi:hypothetical protein
MTTLCGAPGTPSLLTCTLPAGLHEWHADERWVWSDAAPVRLCDECDKRLYHEGEHGGPTLVGSPSFHLPPSDETTSELRARLGYVETEPVRRRTRRRLSFGRVGRAVAVLLGRDD